MIRCLRQDNFGPQHVVNGLGLTPSSLHLRLKAEGTSFKRLLDDTRRCLAHRYLVESSLKLTDIAARVGYSSSAPSAAPRVVGSAQAARSFCCRPPNLDATA
jgi:AraC-like DNA-binding protein